MSKYEKKHPANMIMAIKLTAPGVKRCGNFLAGVVYRVPEQVSAEEAKRLVEIKGFNIVED
jgi:hypothetical protein